MTKALYRKYRSKNLNEIVGQNHVTDVLSRSIKQGKISHAYLLTGPRGVGKTSIARILAHEINGLEYSDDSNHLDIIEIDAASNNSIEDVRDLRDKVRMAPVSASKKVYIIDEVHMLSKAAFNALLKTLEEPPDHVVFILATTDMSKLPDTIVSRTQRFGFHAISKNDAVKHLRFIADKENIAIDNEALELIAEHGDGSFRDSISLLDQLSSLAEKQSKISRELIELTLGLAPQSSIDDILKAYDNNDLPTIISILDKSELDSTEARVISGQLIRTLMNKVIENPKYIKLLDKLIEVTESSQPNIKLLVALAPQNATKPNKNIETKIEPKAISNNSINKTIIKKSTSPSNFDWQSFTDNVRKKSITTYSLINKSSHEYDDQKLTIYVSSKFNKNNVDKKSHKDKLIEVLESMGFDNTIITVLTSDKRVKKDSQVATITAIMGGGEEIII